ncbi:MAG: UDP-N-acetylmuramoyl-L-alanyl-D-glutamate--2,6-diaminopimelate ligase, partial [Chloroflexi bacterium]|nr:UDP-N-acetylmuramoyl-L-alanyl-D-glutamate--2,6-diaminopimelate ligase [Chloroflexota bacterium]
MYQTAYNFPMPNHSLKHLFAESQAHTPVPEGVEVNGIVLDSRQIQPGNLFVALVGGQVDGHQYIADAYERGAAAVLGTQPLSGSVANYVQVADDRLALAELSAAFYDYPARKLTLIGVTGTDGKTTTANLIYHILRAADLKAGMITTVNALIGDEELDTGFHVTTPEAPDVQRYLRQMVDAGLTHAVMETTSHGLAQQRVGAIKFDLAVVTNITHEHLDYHGSYEKYRAAKGRLFQSLKPDGLAILNRDDASYEFLAELTRARRLSYGQHAESDLRATHIEHGPAGLNFTARHNDNQWQLTSPLIGAYNVSNALAAFAAGVLGLGLPAQSAIQGIASLHAVPGRMQVIDLGQDFTA